MTQNQALLLLGPLVVVACQHRNVYLNQICWTEWDDRSGGDPTDLEWYSATVNADPLYFCAAYLPFVAYLIESVRQEHPDAWLHAQAMRIVFDSAIERKSDSSHEPDFRRQVELACILAFRVLSETLAVDFDSMKEVAIQMSSICENALTALEELSPA